MIFGHISLCIISLTFFSIKKSGNHFERDSGEFSLRSHSNLKMGDNVLREIQNFLEYSTLEYAIVTQK